MNEASRVGSGAPPRNARYAIIPKEIAAATLLAVLAVPGGARAATPIANGAPTSLPAYSGAPVEPHRVRAKWPPRNPFMARNPRNNIHDDPWMSDTYRYKGPLGRTPETLSTALGRVCVTVTFDRRGRIVATCSSLDGPHLFMLDPDTLDALAELILPFVPPPPGTDPTQNTAGGAYFFSTITTAPPSPPRRGTS